jgi:hypothetical protein
MEQTNKNFSSFPLYAAGTVTALTLHLTKRGCLSASHAQHEEKLQLFENMLLNGEGRLDRSFVPAASLKSPFHPPGTTWRTSVYVIKLHNVFNRKQMLQ